MGMEKYELERRREAREKRMREQGLVCVCEALHDPNQWPFTPFCPACENSIRD